MRLLARKSSSSNTYMIYIYIYTYTHPHIILIYSISTGLWWTEIITYLNNTRFSCDKCLCQSVYINSKQNPLQLIIFNWHCHFSPRPATSNNLLCGEQYYDITAFDVIYLQAYNYSFWPDNTVTYAFILKVVL